MQNENQVDGLNKKHKLSERMKLTDDLRDTSGGIPSSRRTEDAADTSSSKWQLRKKFEIFSRRLNVEIASSSNKRQEIEKIGRKSAF